MANKIAFIGSSYLVSDGHYLKESERRDRKENDPDIYIINNQKIPDNFVTHGKGLNFAQELSKQNPWATLYNISYSGAGIDTIPDRITYTEENYDPDLYCIEIPTGMRLTWHIDDRYLHEYEDFYPLQIFKGGKLLNPNKKYNRIPRLGNGWVNLSKKVLQSQWEEELYHMVPSSNITAITRFLTTYSEIARMKQVISTLKLAYGYLRNHGKQVKFYQWEQPFTDFSENDKEFLRNNLINETYFLEWASIQAKAPKLKDYLRPDDSSHLNFKGFKKFANYFDPIFNMAKAL